MSLVHKLKRPEFEKVAIRTSLGENPANYPSELLAQLYKQHPWLSSYDVSVQIHKQDDAAGYLYGVFVARPMAYEQSPEAPSVRIPIVVASRRVYPFDVFITKDGRFFPVTETRVSNSLYEASAFKSVSKDSLPFQPGSATSSFVTGGMDDAQISGRYGQGYGSQIKVSSPLDTVLGGASPELLSAFLLRVDQSEALRASAMEIPAFARALDKIRSAEPVIKSASIESNAVAPVAAVLLKGADGFSILTTFTDPAGAILPAMKKISLARIDLDAIPVSFRQEALSKGYAFLGHENQEALEEITVDGGGLSKIATAKETGIYATMDSGNKACRVAVVGNVLGIDGRHTDLSLVLGENGASVQEKIAGIRDGDLDLDVVVGVEPTGRGVFINGDSVTEPVNIRATMLSDTGNTIVVDNDLGQRFHLKLASVKKQAQYDTNKYLFPANAKFMHIKDAERPYVTDIARLTKFASVQEVMDSVTIAYNQQGGVDILDNVGKLLHKTASAPEAGLYLMAMGDSAVGAADKLAKMASSKCSRMRLVPKRTISKGVTKIASKRLSVADIQIDLVKEAAGLAVPDTIETVLSLNFVTPETVTAYLEHMPALEECVSKLAELLLASRIGVQDIPEGAIASAMSGIERAIQGLKKLQIRLSLPTDESSFS